MRIAIFTECYIPEINGVVYHIEALRRGLVKLGHEVLIVRPDSEIKKHRIENNILYTPAIKLKRMYDYSMTYPYSKKRLKLLKNWKPDIIHIHTEFSQGFFALYAGKKLNIPIVYTIHTMYYDYVHYFGVLQNWTAVKKLINWGILKYTNSSKAVICASSKMEGFLKACGAAVPIYRVPNACVSKDFAESSLDKTIFQKLQEQYKINSAGLNVCFCGRIAAEKNLDLMIKYWKKVLEEIPNSKLLIIGDGPDKKSLEEKASELGEAVIFTGKVDHNLIKYYYHMCDAYLMTSLSENHSISALEAAACGLPIVHIYDETNEDQYIEGLTGFSFKDADKLISILKNIYKCNRLNEKENRLKNKIISISANNDYQSMTMKIVNIYKTVAKQYADNA